MNILVLSNTSLSAALGDGVRALGVLGPLARRHRFDLLCFVRPGESPEPRLAQVFRSVTALPLPSPPPPSRLGRWSDAVSLPRFRPQSEAMRREIRDRVESGEVDLVLDVAANMLLNLPERLSVPLVVDSVDEALLRELRDLRDVPWREKPRVLHKTWMFWRYERRTMGRASANVYVSPIDADTYRRFFPGRPTTVVPNGVDAAHFAPVDVVPEPATLVFEGNMMFEPNVVTARRLALDVLPRVRAAVPDARLVLVGRNPVPEVSELAGPAVTVTGTVDDVRPYLARGTVFACPMRRGSGIKNKILQAWAMARPVVASSASLGGLSAHDGVNVLVRDDDAAFAEAVVELIRAPARAARLGQGGRSTVEREYGWAQRAAQFEAVLLDAAARWQQRARGASASATAS